VALGFALICGGAAAAIYEASRPDDSPIMRFPTAIAVSDTGELFVFSEWSRIRVFDPNGHELRSWRVDTSQGMAVLEFEQPEILAVATARNDRLYRFSPAGELLTSEHDPGALERIGVHARRTARGPTDEIYQIEDMSIIRRQRNTAEVVVPGVPTLLRPFFFAGMPPIVFAVQGMVVLVLGAALVAQRSSLERWVAAQHGAAADEPQRVPIDR
jgi:hypothetical protein